MPSNLRTPPNSDYRIGDTDDSMQGLPLFVSSFDSPLMAIARTLQISVRCRHWFRLK
jgi:hypothetical protein